MRGEARLMVMRTIHPGSLNMDKPLLVGVARNQAAVFERWYRDLRAIGVMEGAVLV